MKRNIVLRILSLTICAVMVCAAGAAAADADSSGQEAGASAKLSPVRVWGTVTKLENGSLLLENSDENDPNREIVVHIGNALCLDAVTGLPLNPDALKDGDMAYAWVGPAMTMSLPPQASAAVIVGNIPADYAVPQYYQVAEVKPQSMIAIYPPPALTYVDLETTDGHALKITDQAELTAYLTKNIVRLEDFIPGTSFLVWSDAGGTPQRVMVFPYAYRGYAAWTEDGRVTVNGAPLAVNARKNADGTVLLPVRAMAEALGMEVSWEKGKGAVVKENGQTVFTALPGREADLPDGEEAPYGLCMMENGTTYLPASCLLSLLNLFREG